MADEVAYTCHRCHNVFRLAVTGGPPAEQAECPRCGTTDTALMSAWAPIGYNLSEGPPEWQCACQQCGKVFKVAVPGSPAEASKITCPVCRGKHIHRLTPAGVEPLYCG